MPATAGARSAKRWPGRSPLDYAPPFQMGHPLPFELAARLAEIAPPGLNKVFFTNSGSESADTALKIALAYQRAIGQGTRTRLIGRELGYHGVGFGGLSVGGMVNNRKAFSANLLPGVDHLPHTLDVARNASLSACPRAWRGKGRGAGTPGDPARRREYRRGDRRADVRLGRRGAAAQGLPSAAARDHPQAWHPADLRRSDHRFRPRRRSLRRAALGRRPGPADLRRG